jgi:hypothetical protein
MPWLILALRLQKYSVVLRELQRLGLLSIFWHDRDFQWPRCRRFFDDHIRSDLTDIQSGRTARRRVLLVMRPFPTFEEDAECPFYDLYLRFF